MNGSLQDALYLKYKPVGIWFESNMPQHQEESEAKPTRCVVPYLIAAATKDKTTCLSEEKVLCPGGAVGLGFGDAFEKRNASTLFLLSHGEGADGYDPSMKLPPHMKQGERFFDCPATVKKWKDSLELTEADYTYVCFAPLDETKRPYDRNPDLVFLLANPDQLAALVIMCGYRNGRPVNVVASFVSGCQSILLAKKELGKPDPLTIMGMFDISQRYQIDKDLLSLTMTFDVYAQIVHDLPESCITTSAWEKIEPRV